MRSDSEIKAIIESAFRPLRCAAEVWDHEDKVRFRVFDPEDRPLVNMIKAKLPLLRNDSYLAVVIKRVREEIEAKGFLLEPWSLK